MKEESLWKFILIVSNIIHLAIQLNDIVPITVKSQSTFA